MVHNSEHRVKSSKVDSGPLLVLSPTFSFNYEEWESPLGVRNLLEDIFRFHLSNLILDHLLVLRSHLVRGYLHRPSFRQQFDLDRRFFERG